MQPTSRGFTLTEMLVVVAIIMLLLSFGSSMILRGAEMGRRAQCMSNLRQIMIAALSRPLDTGCKAYIPTRDNGDDSLAFLFPDYLRDARFAACASTENQVRAGVMYDDPNGWYRDRVPVDLHQVASNAEDEFGHSYEVWAWMPGATILPDGVMAPPASEFGHMNKQRCLKPGDAGYVPGDPTSTYVLKTKRTVTHPSRTLLVLDSDQGGGPTAEDINNWPDPINNHKTDGLNIAYLDGTVHWRPSGPELVEQYARDFHPGVNANWQDVHPTLNSRATTVDGVAYTKWYYMTP